MAILAIALPPLSKGVFYPFKNTETIIWKIGCRLFDFNEIELRTTDNINLNEITIKNGDKVVFKNGRRKDNITQDYGHTILDVYHKNLLIAEVGHFKTNNWYVNSYQIQLSKNEHQLLISHEIEGPSSSYDNFQKRYIYNQNNELVQIDYLNAAGEVYNSKAIQAIE